MRGQKHLFATSDLTTMDFPKKYLCQYQQHKIHLFRSHHTFIYVANSLFLATFYFHSSFVFCFSDSAPLPCKPLYWCKCSPTENLGEIKVVSWQSCQPINHRPSLMLTIAHQMDDADRKKGCVVVQSATESERQGHGVAGAISKQARAVRAE